MNKPRLVILSDIFGFSKDLWMSEYRKNLNPYFELVEYDSRTLAGITTPDPSQVHSEFINGGIERAVENLRFLEPNASTVLGFSIGGTIAWKYSLAVEIKNILHLVSATRLRNEKYKPSSVLNLYFGELETNGPSKVWFENFNLTPTIFKNENHECYRAMTSAKIISSKLISGIV